MGINTHERVIVVYFYASLNIFKVYLNKSIASLNVIVKRNIMYEQHRTVMTLDIKKYENQQK